MLMLNGRRRLGRRGWLLPFPADGSRGPGRWLPALAVWLMAAAVGWSQDDLTRQPALDEGEAQRMTLGAAGTPPITFDTVTIPPSIQRDRQAALRQTLRPITQPEAALRMRALEDVIDYDEIDQILYAPGRTQLEYGQYYLEADKVIVDARLQEIQAEGNVLLRIRQDVGPPNDIYADSLRFNFREGEGVAYNVSGQHGFIFFRNAAREGDLPPNTPQLQKLSEQESIFRRTSLTTCDFTIPHYSVTGREIILYERDRVFIRSATFRVWGVPVFYLPAYSRSLLESSPWFVQVGWGSRTGPRIRVGYGYRHKTMEPSFKQDDLLEERSGGRADVYMDYLSEYGPGAGFDYEYQFAYNKHRGRMSLYGLHDGDREVAGTQLLNPEEIFDLTGQVQNDNLQSEPNRWRVLWQHRSEITDELTFRLNIDEFSDPDIFYDILDNFGRLDEERDRYVLRRSRAALSFVNEVLAIHLLADLKDRIGIDRYTDFSRPSDDNRQFDLQPDRRLEDVDSDGISADRWAAASRRLPQVDIQTRWLPIGNRPLYYLTELYLYNNLDKGFNSLNQRDDAYVRGAEIYQALLYQWKLSERYTLLAQAGIGVGVADRENHDLDPTYRTTTIAAPTLADPLNTEEVVLFPNQVGGMVFIDDDGNFLVGRRTMNMEDIEPTYVWGDAKLQFLARFSDALSGDLLWRIRETTDDFIGDWYASTGNLTFRDDLFDYKIREHWVEGGLDYRLARPLINAFVRGGYNLVSRGDVFSKEDLAFARTGLGWSNQRQTLAIRGSVGWEKDQQFDPSDIRAYEDEEIHLKAALSYSPIHGRWFIQLELERDIELDQRSEVDDQKKLTFFTEDESQTEARLTFGRELGPKWKTEIEVEWDDEVGGLRELAWLLERDLHDAVAILRVEVENDEEDADDRETSASESPQIDVRLGLKFKIPGQNVAFGVEEVDTIQREQRRAQLAY